MPLIPFPYVPALPGVPYLSRLVGQVIPTPVAVAAGVVGALLGTLTQSQTQWGIYDSRGRPMGGTSVQLFGGPVLSTNALEFRKETRVSDFPVQSGDFATYNKVQMPSTPMVTLALAGSESDRAGFLAEVDAACNSTDLYSVVTPEITYINHTFERYNYSRRSRRGATLLIVEIYLKEVRQVSAQYSTGTVNPQIGTPQTTSATPTIDSGIVQTQTPTQHAQAGVNTKLSIFSGK